MKKSAKSFVYIRSDAVCGDGLSFLKNPRSLCLHAQVVCVDQIRLESGDRLPLKKKSAKSFVYIISGGVRGSAETRR